MKNFEVVTVGMRVKHVVTENEYIVVCVAPFTIAKPSNPSDTRVRETSMFRSMNNRCLMTADEMAGFEARRKERESEKPDYRCLECGAAHNARICPKCGGRDRFDNV